MKTALKKLLVTALAGGLVVNSTYAMPAVDAKENTAKVTKDAVEGITQEKIDAANDAYNDVKTKIEFLTMSDMEFGGKPDDISQTQEVSYEEKNFLYQRIRAWADKKNFQVNAIMANGDIVGANEPEYYDCAAGNKSRVQGWYRAVEQALTENFGDLDPAYILASGNHDIADVMGQVFDEKHKDDEKWFYGDSETNYVGNHHAKVNGFDFITLDYNGTNTFGYGGQHSGYQEFLRNTLQEISSASDYDPTKPIFLQAHSGYAGTTLGGQWAGVYDTMGMDVQNILADYPQAVIFSAHTHFPVEEESAICQKNFTFVENGSMNYIYKDVPGDFMEGGYLDTGNSEIPERTCNFISILEDGTTVVRRFDVSNERWIGMPWIIDTTNGKEGFRYTADKRSKIKPWFDEAAQIHTFDVTETGLTLEFDHADDDELVNHYEVTIKDSFTGNAAAMRVKQVPVKGEAAEKSVNGSFRTLSRYYYRPNTMRFEISGLQTGRVYTAEIYAVDDFGNKSEEPLTGSFKMAGVMGFPTIDGGIVLPEDIEEGKYFEMNFEDNLNESIGNKNGTANGSISYTDSYRADLGKAVTVGGGSGDYIDLGNRDEWNLGTDKEMTINFWIKVNSCGGYGSIISNKNWTNWYRKGINVAPEGSNTGKLEFTLGDDVRDHGVYATGEVPQYTGSWHMMTFTVDRANQVAKTFMDGKLYAQVDIGNVGDMTSNLNMLVGVDAGRAYGSIGFDMDQLEMWDRPLSEEDIKTYYNVTKDASDLVKEGIYYAENYLAEIEENKNNQVYDETLTQNLRDAIKAAKEEPTLEMYLNLKACVEAATAQPVRYAVSVTANNGMVSPESQIVNEGEDAVFAMIPAAGYQIQGSTVSVEGDSAYRIEGDNLIVEDIKASTQVSISFKKQSSEEPGDTVSKNTLKYFLEKAEAHVADGDTDNCPDAVKGLFETAIAEAKTVMEKPDATREEVQNATIRLMLAIHALDFRAVDKEALGMAIELAESIDLSKYVETGKAEFGAALAEARNVYENEDVSQEKVDKAWDNLVKSIGELRLKVDKQTLEDLLTSLEGLDLSQYTEESVRAFRAALAAANDVVADDTLSEDDQKIVDNVVKALADAADALDAKADDTKKDDGSKNDGNSNGTKDSNDKNVSGSPKTGDMSNPTFMMTLFAIAGSIFVFLERKRRNRE